MRTKYYVIQYNEGKGWKDYDSTEYTEQEIRECMPSDNEQIKFRKKFIKEAETVLLSVSRERLNAFNANEFNIHTPSELVEQAIQYVRENKTWSEAEERVALDRINNLRCDINQASDKIACEIADLMAEWSADNNLCENWWWQYVNEDDIFFQL